MARSSRNGDLAAFLVIMLVGKKEHLFKKESQMSFWTSRSNLFLHLINEIKLKFHYFIIRGGRHENPIQNTIVIYRIFSKEMILNKYFLEKKIYKYKKLKHIWNRSIMCNKTTEIFFLYYYDIINSLSDNNNFAKINKKKMMEKK